MPPHDENLMNAEFSGGGAAVSADALAALKGALEALLFVTPEPLTLDSLCEAAGDPDRARVFQALCELQASHEREERGLCVVEIAGGYRLATKPRLDDSVRRLLAAQNSRKLSRAALETLAIVAYRQPVTAPEIEAVRGIDSTGILKTLLDRRLVKIAGRKDVVGRPFLWKTTPDFLDHFGLKGLRDLPRSEEFKDLLPGVPGLDGPSLFEAPSDSGDAGGDTDGGEE
jgi:segregation and condensation protein B